MTVCYGIGRYKMVLQNTDKNIKNCTALHKDELKRIFTPIHFSYIGIVYVTKMYFPDSG